MLQDRLVVMTGSGAKCWIQIWTSMVLLVAGAHGKSLWVGMPVPCLPAPAGIMALNKSLHVSDAASPPLLFD